jgi:hypothetical protein
VCVLTSLACVVVQEEDSSRGSMHQEMELQLAGEEPRASTGAGAANLTEYLGDRSHEVAVAAKDMMKGGGEGSKV